MKKKIVAIVIACLMSAIVISYALYRVVDYSNHYEITVAIDYGNDQTRVYTLEAGGVVLMPKEPVREGYTFVGWYADKGLTKEYNFNKEVNHNITIYAKWTKN